MDSERFRPNKREYKKSKKVSDYPGDVIRNGAPRVIVEIKDGRVYWFSSEVDIQVVTVNHDKGVVRRRPIRRAKEDFFDGYFELADAIEKDDE